MQCVGKAHFWQLPFLSHCQIHSEYKKNKKNTEMESPYLTDTLTDRLKWKPIWGIEEWIADTVTLLDYRMRSQTGSRARYGDKKRWYKCNSKGCEGNVQCGKLIVIKRKHLIFFPWCCHNCSSANLEIVSGTFGEGFAIISMCESIWTVLSCSSCDGTWMYYIISPYDVLFIIIYQMKKERLKCC